MAAKAIALTCIELFLNSEIVKEAKNEFEK